MSSYYGYANNYTPTPKRKTPAAPGDWLSALNARSQGLNALYGLPKKAGSGTSAGSEPTDPYASADAGVESIIAAMLAAVEREKQAAYESAQREAQMEYQKGQALAEGLKHLGISDAVQRAFGNAAQAQSGLAQGFSGNIREQASAQAAEQQRLLSGTGQEGAVRNQGEAMGNVTYGVGGHMPATALNSMAAAFGADAALQPGFALQFGALAEQARRNQWVEDELPEWTNRIMDVHDKKPAMLQDAREDAYDRALELEKLARSGSSSSTKLQKSTLANGQIQWWNPVTGKPVGKPQGPARTSTASTTKLQAKPYGDGRYIAWDPTTGKTVGTPFGTKKKSGSSGQKSYSLQAKPTKDGRLQWYDPRTGKPVGAPFGHSGPAKTPAPATKPPRADEAGRTNNRTDGVSDAAARNYKQTAFLTAQQWHAQGGKVNLGTEKAPNIVEMTPLDVLKHMVNVGGVPYDIAVRQLARFHPKAREWIKTRTNPLTGVTTPKSTATKPTAKPASAVDLTPGGGWGGSYNIANSLASVAKANGLSVWSEKRSTRNTASGGVSDHWTGSKDAYAYDLSNGNSPTPEMDRTAMQIVAALGGSYDGKSELVKNFYRNGYRIQILYRTNVGGNHFNHVHVGVRREGGRS